ncbi:MAG: hypothetical protein K0B10_13835, partial [Vicingaceae bacterium]|nr:hypothetical protein [Vicingaceae bacterium]
TNGLTRYTDWFKDRLKKTKLLKKIKLLKINIFYWKSTQNLSGVKICEICGKKEKNRWLSSQWEWKNSNLKIDNFGKCIVLKLIT